MKFRWTWIWVACLRVRPQCGEQYAGIQTSLMNGSITLKSFHLRLRCELLCLACIDSTQFFLPAMYVWTSMKEDTVRWRNGRMTIYYEHTSICRFAACAVETRSSTVPVLSIFLPHTSIKCGRTDTALEFSWMVGKVSLSEVVNISSWTQLDLDLHKGWAATIMTFTQVVVKILTWKPSNLNDPELAATSSSGFCPTLPSGCLRISSRELVGISDSKDAPSGSLVFTRGKKNKRMESCNQPSPYPPDPTDFDDIACVILWVEFM